MSPVRIAIAINAVVEAACSGQPVGITP